MSSQFEIIAPLKGTRSYLHGTDICERIIEEFSEFKSLSILLKSPSRYSVLLSSPIDQKGVICGIVDLELGVSSRRYVLSTGKTELTERREYNESLVSSECQIDPLERSVKCPRIEGFTVIEQMVSMNKYLLCQLVNDGDWAFTKLVLYHAIPTLCRGLSLEIATSLGSRMVSSKAYIDTIEIGSIVFVGAKL